MLRKATCQIKRKHKREASLNGVERRFSFYGIGNCSIFRTLLIRNNNTSIGGIQRTDASGICDIDVFKFDQF